MAFTELVAPARCVTCRRRGAALCDTCGRDLRGPLGLPSITHVDRLFVPWFYEGAARDLVLGLKIRSLAFAAEAMAEAIWHRVVADGTRCRTITWVPARRADIRKRGFDHARLIAEALADRLGLAAAGLLHRIGTQSDQAALSRAERARNLRGAFTAERVGGPILLVDDLITTGATLAACATALRTAGAARIEGAAACMAE
ncbi:MAG: hypothetical protein M3290_05955 [Actinomycetota bacterium]|nr:hypothetical protein [Actinomycetota bacterium]